MLAGRVGMTWDRMLLYITGGGAWARDKFEYVAAGVGTASASDTRFGWTIGAGLEFALAPNWSLAAQYNYVDFGNRDTSFSGGGVVAFTDRIDQQLHLVTARLNYRFGGPVVARY
jgi:outer membrane immunogenic protein